LIYVVLGMHKSGTTLISQILHHSGINMGDFDSGASYDMGNKYERQDCLRLNMEILAAIDFEILDLDNDSAVTTTQTQIQQMRDIIENCDNKYPAWGFKDPRCCLTYSLWAQELSEHKIIVVYRSPEQIWPRFRWQGMRKYHTNFHRAYSFLKRWHEHNFSVLNVLEQGGRNTLVLNYQDFMNSDAGFVELEKFVGHDLQDRRRSGLYRSYIGTRSRFRNADARYHVPGNTGGQEFFPEFI